MGCFRAGLRSAADRIMLHRSMTELRTFAETAPEDRSAGPLPAYRARLRAGQLETDPSQAMAAETLQHLWSRLRGYDPQPLAGSHGVFARILRRKPTEGAPEERPHGLYLVGRVGRGKSMLMDLFFAAAQVSRKRRLHFLGFMQEAHKRIHAWREASPAGADPVPPLAETIAAEAALLCFDEFQINDIADALILGRLFEALFARGVVVVATSNTAPDDLFAGQPGRDAFLPFIGLIKSHLDLLVLDGARDWRRARLDHFTPWLVPADAWARSELDAAFAALAADEPIRSQRLAVMGREFVVPAAAAGVARFRFAALCEAAIGPGDYLALATHFHTLILDGIPRLGPENRDVARRFVTLIDALYDHGVTLLASAAAAPDELWPADTAEAGLARTASRLTEMQSRAYSRRAHLT